MSTLLQCAFTMRKPIEEQIYIKKYQPNWGQHSPQRLAQLRATSLLLQVNFLPRSKPLRFLIRLHRIRLVFLCPCCLYSRRKFLLMHCFWSWQKVVFFLHSENSGLWHCCLVAMVLQLVSRRRPVALSVTVTLMHSSSKPSSSGSGPSRRKKRRL